MERGRERDYLTYNSILYIISTDTILDYILSFCTVLCCNLLSSTHRITLPYNAKHVPVTILLASMESAGQKL